MSDNQRKAVLAVERATVGVTTLDQLGLAIVETVTGFISFDRFNIGLIDQRLNLFRDEYAFGHNVAGRQQGHRRTLDGSVVEAAIQAGDGYYFGSNDLQQWLERFPRFKPVFDSGMRAMLAVPLTKNKQACAALVFASKDADAYSQKSLAIAIDIGDVVLAKLELLTVIPVNI